MTWLLTDQIGRLFLVMPVFTVVMVLVTSYRISTVRDTPPALVPVAYATVVAAVVGYWIAGAPASSLRILERSITEVSLRVPLLGAVLIAATFAIYLLELWMSDAVEGLKNRLDQRESVLAPLNAIADFGPVPALRNPMPSSEAFAAVRSISRRPTSFATISCATAVGEELLYRVAMLALLTATVGTVAAVGIQAVAYALNHLPFGVPSMIGKLAFGAALGAGTAASGSVLPALGAHALFQLLVFRRTRRVDGWT